MKLTRFLILIILSLSAGLFSGCFALPVEEDYVPPAVFTLREPRPWRTAAVTRGDVEVFTTITATHQPAREEVIFFPEVGVLVTGIYVSVGDEVSAGDIIASLDRRTTGDDLDRLLRDESRLLLRLQQLNEQHENTLWRADVSGIPVDDTSYINRRRDMLEDLHIIRSEIDYIQRQFDDHFIIRASMDGTVTQVMTFVEGMRSTRTRMVPIANGVMLRDDPLVVIGDQSLSIFVVSVREAELLHPGDRFIMEVEGNQLWTEVIDPLAYNIIRPEVAWTEAILIYDDDDLAFSPRAMGRINAVFATSSDVLRIPIRALYYAEGRHFVYVLDNGIRRVRDVVIGLEGTQFVEIISGLSEGEWVVI